VCCITVLLKRLYFDDLVANGCTEQQTNYLQTRNYTVTVISSSCKCAYFYASDSNVAVSLLPLLKFVIYLLF
jgi:hypothetical protein